MKHDLSRVISAEWLKLKRRRSTYVVPLLVVALSVLVFLGLGTAAKREWIGVPSGFYMTSATIAWLVDVLAILTVVITCFHISGEFSLGTVKAAWTKPITRRHWYAGKLIFACASASALFIALIAVVVVLAAVRFGFTDLMEKDYLIHTRSGLGLALVLVLALTFWALWAVTAVSAALAGLFNHAGTSIAAGLGLGLLMTVLSIFPSVKPFLLSTHINVPMEQMIAMSKGLPLPFDWSELAWKTLVGAGAWLVLALLAGDRIIRNKEITF
jgi:ABC-type transport system involved in multi-copper enzyme maturation permease subunit